jgi:hypothetical protein
MKPRFVRMKLFFSLEYAKDLRIIALRRRVQKYK